MRIGLFAHSTNPRGGVVHTLELADALADRGHQVVVHAPAEPGNRFFRESRATIALVPAGALRATGLGALVSQRVEEYLSYLRPRRREFDVYHAQDGISANALAVLVEGQVIPGFLRTVHHLDKFSDESLRKAQDRSVLSASECVCVSRMWRSALQTEYGVRARVVGNGVDPNRFRPQPGAIDAKWLSRFDLARHEPIFLAVGGVERRKNTLNILRAFERARNTLGRATLVIAGGASLLDHSQYRREFEQVLSACDEPVRRSVVITGPLTDDEMAAAYRSAAALVFPSLNEGFGLCVLEAMACATPVITSCIPPFTEYLSEADALLVDPHEVSSIARAMLDVVNPSNGPRLGSAGLAVSRRFTWAAVATAHESVYQGLIDRWEGELRARNALPGPMAG